LIGDSEMEKLHRKISDFYSTIIILCKERFDIIEIDWLHVNPCFKYRTSRPRYRPISPFLPAVDTI